jgi:hypothetical protein
MKTDPLRSESVEEPSNNADNEDNFERSENNTELDSSDSVVAVKAEDDNIEYYMLKVTSGLETLSTTEKDSWGVEYPSGFQIFRGSHYLHYLRVLLRV